ncbi:MAG: hypothetical protein WCV90_02685 [Candidatus Woesearchaeota archaeon]
MATKNQRIRIYVSEEGEDYHFFNDSQSFLDWIEDNRFRTIWGNSIPDVTKWTYEKRQDNLENQLDNSDARYNERERKREEFQQRYHRFPIYEITVKRIGFADREGNIFG